MTNARLMILAVLAVLLTATVAPAQSKPASKPKSQPKGTTKPEKPTPGGSKPVKGMAYVKISTSLGDMIIELNADKAPKTVENFLHYADTKFFEGLIFHRVMSNFMVQGGGFSAEGIDSPVARPKTPTRKPIQNEADNGLKNEYGTIAMARTGDPHSATSQFFINVKSNAALNHTGKSNSRAWGYAVFGAVKGKKSFETLEKIRNVKTKFLPIMRANVLPDPVVTIKSVRRMKPEEVAKELGKK